MYYEAATIDLINDNLSGCFVSTIAVDRLTRRQ